MAALFFCGHTLLYLPIYHISPAYELSVCVAVELPGRPQLIFRMDILNWDTEHARRREAPLRQLLIEASGDGINEKWGPDSGQNLLVGDVELSHRALSDLQSIPGVKGSC